MPKTWPSFGQMGKTIDNFFLTGPKNYPILHPPTIIGRLAEPMPLDPSSGGRNRETGAETAAETAWQACETGETGEQIRKLIPVLFYLLINRYWFHRFHTPATRFQPRFQPRFHGFLPAPPGPASIGSNMGSPCSFPQP